MITKKSLISGFLAVGFAINPLYIQAGFWDVLNPFSVAKILVKSKASSKNILIEENLAYFNFSTVQNDSVLAIRPITISKTYLPADRHGNPKKFYTVSATGYSSTPEQTDLTPFITASGIHVRDGVIAANFLPFGTIIKIPELFGDKTFVVEDRMHNRYWLNIDIWFPEKDLAKEFGIKVIKIEIIS